MQSELEYINANAESSVLVLPSSSVMVYGRLYATHEPKER